jgi:hypothetical protein
MKSITQNPELFAINTNNTNNNVILINSESLSSILEKNAITLKWCKLCNMIVKDKLNFLVT